MTEDRSKKTIEIEVENKKGFSVGSIITIIVMAFFGIVFIMISSTFFGIYNNPDITESGNFLVDIIVTIIGLSVIVSISLAMAILFMILGGILIFIIIIMLMRRL